MTLKDDTMRLASLRALAAIIATEVETLTRSVETDMREIGGRTIDVRLADEQIVATISTATGSDRAAVGDAAAFTAWVEQYHPSEIVTEVRPSYRKACLAGLAPTGDGGWLDPSTGEIVPGVMTKAGSRYLSVRQDAEQRDQIAVAWAEGTLTIEGWPSALSLPQVAGQE